MLRLSVILLRDYHIFEVGRHDARWLSVYWKLLLRQCSIFPTYSNMLKSCCWRNWNKLLQVLFSKYLFRCFDYWKYNMAGQFQMEVLHVIDACIRHAQSNNVAVNTVRLDLSRYGVRLIDWLPLVIIVCVLLLLSQLLLWKLHQKLICRFR